jgi:hypothetical protein
MKQNRLRRNYDIGSNESNDGLIFSYRLQFHEDCPSEILNKIPSLNDGSWVDISQNIFDEPEHE